MEASDVEDMQLVEPDLSSGAFSADAANQASKDGDDDDLSLQGAVAAASYLEPELVSIASGTVIPSIIIIFAHALYQIVI